MKIKNLAGGVLFSAVSAMATAGNAHGSQDQGIDDINLNNDNAAAMVIDGSDGNDTLGKVADFKNARNAELQNEVAPSMTYLLEEHGVESGCIVEHTDPDDGEKYLVLDPLNNPDLGVQPTDSEAKAMGVCYEAVIDMTDKADHKYLQSQGIGQNISLEDFKVDLSQNMEEIQALNGLAADAFGPRVDTELNAPGLSHPAFVENAQDIQDQFSGGHTFDEIEEIKDQIVNKKTHHIDANLNSLESDNLSHAERLQALGEVYGTPDKAGAAHAVSAAMDMAQRVAMMQEQEVASIDIERTSPSINLEYSVEQVESPIGTEYNPDADPLPDRDDDDLGR